MAKIIKDGIIYGGSPTDASHVSYNNSISGLSATNVNSAIDELSQSSGASSVAQLEDVQLNNLSDNDLLVYDSNLTGGKLWKNAKKIVTCTKSQFDTWSANDSFPYTDCKYIVTDVNNLNTTSADIPYDSTGTDSVKDVLDSKAATSIVSTKQNDMSGGSIRNVDLNTLTETKSYWVNNEGITNAPVNTYGYLEVFKQGDSLRLQRYTVFGSYDVYERYYVNSQWYSWSRIGGPSGNGCLNMGQVTTAFTFNTTSATTVFNSKSGVNLYAGNYLFFIDTVCSWTSHSYQFYMGLKVDNTYTEAHNSFSRAVTNSQVTFRGTVNIPSTSSHTLQLAARVTDSSKTISFEAYSPTLLTLIRI